MKETIKNIKKVYNYGKEYKANLIGVIVSSLGSTIIGIIIPLLVARQIVFLTSSLWKQLLIVSLVIFLIQSYNSFAAMYIFRRNNQKFIRGTMKNLQMKFGKEILKITQNDIDKILLVCLFKG